MPKTGWLHYAENALAPICRKSAGFFMPKITPETHRLYGGTQNCPRPFLIRRPVNTAPRCDRLCDYFATSIAEGVKTLSAS
jgi:hypothetical protein